ncbi:MAG: putative Ig domain-containing protein [Thermoplasmatota archaeon]
MIPRTALFLAMVLLFAPLSLQLGPDRLVSAGPAELRSSLANASASFWGEFAGDRAGTVVSGAGDVNGDGYDDILISTPHNDEGGGVAGKTYLVLGKADNWSMDSYLSGADASFIGEDVDDKSGYSACGAGDVNGDGYDDILIGAPMDEGGSMTAGCTYLIFGRASGWSRDTDLSEANATFFGEDPYDQTGHSIAGAGDVNGDGYDDILIASYLDKDNGAATGQTYLVLGRKEGWSKGASLSRANASFQGEQADDNSGFDVAGAGDVNGDGYDDFLIGAWGNYEGGYPYCGKTYLILGRRSGWEMDVNLENASASFIGENMMDKSGYTVAGAGDVNGDGFDDILIGAMSNGDGGSAAGKTYLVLGRANGWSTGMDLSKANASFIGEDMMDTSGQALAGAGDVNGDGYDDILIGARGDDDAGSGAGQSYLILGRSSGWTRDTDLSRSDASFVGEAAGDDSGASLSGAGDVNGDGKEDILIGAPNCDDAAQSEGQIYLIMIDRIDTRHPPSITTGNVLTCEEDEVYSVMYTAEDPDGDADELIWFCSTDADWLSMDPETRVLKGIPENGDVGDHWVNVSVLDGDGGSDWTNFTLTVINTNDPPEIITEDLTGAVEGIRYSREYEARDIDPTGDLLVWSFDSEGSWLSFDPEACLLSGTPGNADVGDHRVNLSVTDGNGGRDWTNFTLTVINTNDPPEIITENIVSVMEDSEFMVGYEAVDEDPEPGELRWSLETDARWLEFNGATGILHGVPSNSDVGDHHVNLSVADEHGGEDWTNFTLTVINVNDPPVIVPGDIVSAVEDLDYTIKFEGMDIDPTGDILTWSLVTEAGWIEFDPGSATLNGRPDNDDVGSHSVELRVADGNGGADLLNFTVTVENVNDPPLITTDDVLLADIGNLYRIVYEAVDIDPTGDVLKWSLVTEADWLKIDEMTGALEGTPVTPGAYRISVIVDDGWGGTDVSDFILEVVGNPEPVELLRGIGDVNTVEGKPFSMETSAEGIDPSRAVLFSVVSDPPSGITIDPMTGELHWDEPVAGEYLLNISASNGLISCWTEFTLTVSEVEDRDTDGKDGVARELLFGAVMLMMIGILSALAAVLVFRRRMSDISGEEE